MLPGAPGCFQVLPGRFRCSQILLGGFHNVLLGSNGFGRVQVGSGGGIAKGITVHFWSVIFMTAKIKGKVIFGVKLIFQIFMSKKICLS